MSWKAATASTVITPDEPLWLAGYAARTRPAGGTISDLRARALALEDDAGHRLVIASADIIAITKILADPIYERVRPATGLQPHQLVLAGTHTHYGPEFRPDKQVFFKVPPEYATKIVPTAQRLAAQIAGVIIEAIGRLEPARLFVRRTSAGFAHNRRRGGVKDGKPSTEDVLDQDVPILDVMDESLSRRRAVIFGYACHNTTIPPEDCRYCGDWAGFAAEQLQRENGEATALFIPGCGADQNPEPRGSVDLSRQYGRELADAVQKSLASPGDEITGVLRSAMEDVPLALQPVTRDSLQAMLARDDDPPQKVKAKFLLDQLDRGEPLLTSYPAPVQAIRFGDQLLMVVLSGETVVDWSLKFKREFSSVAPHVWIAGYCNDMYGYVPTRRIQEEGGYEGGRANLWSWVPSPWTNDVEDRVVAGVRAVVARVS